jgi:uncharacterized protein YfaS (alpha-2-macroglobulin family)
MTWYVGMVWRPIVSITDGETKEPVDPAQLDLEVLRPDGSKITVTATRLSQGKYRPAIPLTEDGWWRLNADSPTGEHEGFGTAHIPVRPVPTTAG